MKKILCLISLILVFSVVIIYCTTGNNRSTSRTVITKETGHIYETGIKITEDCQTIRNYDFVDIAIGIAVWSSGNYIADCTFTGCSDEGIVFLGGNNNIVENCVFSECVDGVELQWSSYNVFVNCRFSGNTHAGDNRFVNCGFMDNKIDMEER